LERLREAVSNSADITPAVNFGHCGGECGFGAPHQQQQATAATLPNGLSPDPKKILQTAD
jgi:hypothetical protein